MSEIGGEMRKFFTRETTRQNELLQTYSRWCYNLNLACN